MERKKYYSIKKNGLYPLFGGLEEHNIQKSYLTKNPKNNIDYINDNTIKHEH